jgi:hypothetical protein
MRANVPYEIIDKQKIYNSLYLMYLRFGLEKSFHLVKCDEPIKNIRKYRVIHDGSKLKLIEGSSFTRYCHSRQPVRRKKSLMKFLIKMEAAISDVQREVMFNSGNINQLQIDVDNIRYDIRHLSTEINQLIIQVNILEQTLKSILEIKL